ncbi:MAG: hypothetical protein M3552_16180, partial [Planctomycetota bacterium]|nr:hypothetical protein [Planctomycetota bacterium]
MHRRRIDRVASLGRIASRVCAVESLESRLLLSAVTLDPALVASGSAEPEALAHGGGCCCPG